MKLFGWAVRGRPEEADHTYLSCDNGRSWDCFSRGKGGVMIFEAQAGAKHAQHMSALGHDAGIEYAITGIGHQAANRMLWPAGCLLSEAKGFWACAMLFGAYGSDAARWLGSLTGGIPEPSGQTEPPRALTRIAPGLRGLASSIQERYLKAAGGAHDPDELLFDEFALIMDNRLGRSYSRHRSGQIMRRHEELLMRKRALEEALASGSMDMGVYTGELNSALNHALLDIACDIGVRDFISLFEIDPSRPLRIAPSGGGRKRAPARYNKPHGATSAA